MGAVADRGAGGGEGDGRVAMLGTVAVRGREMVGLNCGRSRLIYAQTYGFT